MDELTLSTLIWLRMVRFVQNSNQLSNDHLRRYGLTVGQFEALANIRSDQPLTQSDLAARLTVSGGGISRMLSRLERDGLIVRRQEWKTKFISLTDKGTTLLGEAFPGQLAQQSSMFDEVLDETEKAQLHAILGKLYTRSAERRAILDARTASEYPERAAELPVETSTETSTDQATGVSADQASDQH